MLSEYNYDLKVKENGSNLLQPAVKNNMENIVLFLLERGLLPDNTDENGNGDLMNAMQLKN